MPETEFDLTTISFKAYRQQSELIANAAKAAGYEVISDYMREVLTQAACKQLGQAPPILPPIIRGRGSSLIAQAAAKLGMSREQFDRRAAHLYAAQALGLVQPMQPVKPSHQSGLRPAVRQGGASLSPRAKAAKS